MAEFISLTKMGEVLKNLKEKIPTVKDYTATLGTNWQGSPLSQEIPCAGIASTDTAILDIVLDITKYEQQQEEWGKIVKAEILDNKIRFYARERTASELSIKVKVVNR